MIRISPRDPLSLTYDGISIDNKTQAILIAYQLRNYGGHHLMGNDILVARYEEILSRVMDALFVSIEFL